MTDRVRVVRILEYVGPREAVERQLRCCVRGTIELSPGGVQITGVDLEQYVVSDLVEGILDGARTEPQRAPWCG